MEQKIAKFISVVLHPLLIPTYTFAILFNQKYYFSLIIPYQIKFLIIGVIFITTFLIPVSFVMIMLRRKMIGSLNMENRDERLAPLIVTAVFISLAWYMVSQLNISRIFPLFLLGSGIAVIATILINLKEKISLHMVGIGGMLGAFIGISVRFNIDMTYIIAGIILLSGFVGFARLAANAHTQSEVYKGFFTGLLIMTGVFVFF
jgi:hypothetical protein